MNLDPEAAARAYRERIVGPFRGRLPASALRSMEEQLSGACTVEIAAFDEFSKLLGDPAATRDFDHVVLDTAPTGHTLRLLALPRAWSGFLESSSGSASCLGPLAGLDAQRSLYEATREALADGARTAVVLVARPDRASLAEAERTRGELAALGIANVRFVVNGAFRATDRTDPVALAFEHRGEDALSGLPAGLASLARADVPLRGGGVVGLDEVRGFLGGREPARAPSGEPDVRGFAAWEDLADLLLSAAGPCAVLTVGKGGVGKTTVARHLATDLARAGVRVHLTTTDPAGHDAAEDGPLPPNLRTSRIDADAETRAYAAEVLAAAGPDLDEDARALLEEDLRSPCTQEIAVFRAFARTVDEARESVVVIDTAPTGHTLLLLDAAEAYHREVARTQGPLPDAVRHLLPRLRDPGFTRVLVVTIPEATPVHEAAALQRELRRAGIEPWAWVVTQSLSGLDVRDPVLAARRAAESRWLDEVRALAPRAFLDPWRAGERPPAGRRPDRSSGTAPGPKFSFPEG